MIEFILNNKRIKTNAKSGMSLLHFIREEQGLKGTKSGCKEGDCGACTVLVGSLQEDKVAYNSVTSCLTPLANIHAKHVVTIEGLNIEKDLNVAQSAIKDNFATQCGFCTPGFVTSLSGLALRHVNVHQEDALNAISGNICRCTGYKSIEKAAAEITGKLQDKDTSKPLEWLVAHKFVPEYFISIPDRLRNISAMQAENEGVLVAGGTDLYVRYADALLDQDIQQAQQLVGKHIRIKDGVCTIEAGVSVSDFFKNEDLSSYFKELPAYKKLISSEQIRNMASLAGNFVNASPIGDLSIFFLALPTTLHIKNAFGKSRYIPLKSFFLDYKKTDLATDEYIADFSFELPDKEPFFNFEKVSKRTHLDIATVNTAINLTMTRNLIYDMGLSMGGVAAIPVFLTQTVRFLKGKELSVTLLKEAEEILQSEISPISDVRGTATYKRLLARQLFRAHFIRLFPEQFQLKDFEV